EFGMTSRGKLELAPAGSGTKISWSNEGDLGNNPINRYFGLMMHSWVGKDFEAGLANLKTLAEK
ncbi:MAG: SRPBCC family protein, partial [Burkholderiales bacterium]